MLCAMPHMRQIGDRYEADIQIEFADPVASTGTRIFVCFPDKVLLGKT